MLIEVFGTGCKKCEVLTERATEAAKQAGAEAEVVKVKELLQIAARGVMSTPALAVDGKLLFQGRVPSVEELATMLRK